MIVSQFDVERFTDGPSRLYQVLITNLANKTYLFRLTWQTRPMSEWPFEQQWFTSRRNNWPNDPVVSLERHTPGRTSIRTLWSSRRTPRSR